MHTKKTKTIWGLSQIRHKSSNRQVLDKFMTTKTSLLVYDNFNISELNLFQVIPMGRSVQGKGKEWVSLTNKIKPFQYSLFRKTMQSEYYQCREWSYLKLLILWQSLLGTLCKRYYHWLTGSNCEDMPYMVLNLHQYCNSLHHTFLKIQKW